MIFVINAMKHVLSATVTIIISAWNVQHQDSCMYNLLITLSLKRETTVWMFAQTVSGKIHPIVIVPAQPATQLVRHAMAATSQ